MSDSGNSSPFHTIGGMTLVGVVYARRFSGCGLCITLVGVVCGLRSILWFFLFSIFPSRLAWESGCSWWNLAPHIGWEGNWWSCICICERNIWHGSLPISLLIVYFTPPPSLSIDINLFLHWFYPSVHSTCQCTAHLELYWVNILKPFPLSPLYEIFKQQSVRVALENTVRAGLIWEPMQQEAKQTRNKTLYKYSHTHFEPHPPHAQFGKLLCTQEQC